MVLNPETKQRKKIGDLVKSEDWNSVIEELLQLEKYKVNLHTDNDIKGNLTIDGTLLAKQGVTFNGDLRVMENISVAKKLTSVNLAALGDVSIGTLTPENTEQGGRVLDIQGTSHAKLSIRTNSNNKIDGRFLAHDSGFWGAPAGMMVGTHSNHPLSFGTGAVTRLTILSNGNVGIGTKSPVTKLDISSATRSGTHPTTVKGLYITGDFLSDREGVEFRHSNGMEGIGFGYNTIYAAGSNANQDLGLQAKGTGEVKVTGKLSVSGNLTVTGKVNERNISADGLKLDAHTHNGTDSQKVKHSNLTLDGGTNPHKTTAADVGALSTSGGTVNGNVGISGNVGIGTTNPTAKLDVQGDVKVSGAVSFGSSMRQMLNLYGTVHAIGVQNNTKYFRTSGNFAWYKGGSHNDTALSAGTGGTTLMTLDGSGNLSVLGNISPAGTETNKDLGLQAKGSGQVKVDGKLSVTSDLTVSGGLSVSGNLSVTGSLSFGSSMRQMLNLYGTVHAIGVQNNTKYFRTSGNFAWYKGGSHNDAAFNAGTNGTSLMTLDVSGNLSVLGIISPAGTETNKDLVLKAKGTGKVKIDSSAIITGKVGIGTTDPKAILDVNGSVKFAGNSTIVSRMICGQVFYNTSTSKWQYSTFAEGVNIVKMSESHFKISYGFTVKWTQQLMILATTFEERADHTACVRQIHKDHCVICIINTKDQYQKAQNFSFMIIHYDSPPNSSYFSDVRNESGVVTTAPVNPYYYTP